VNAGAPWAIGVIVGARGLRGELRTRFFRRDPAYLTAGKLFVESARGALQPFVVRQHRADGLDGAFVFLDTIQTREAAEALQGARLHLDPAWFPPGAGPVERLLGAAVRALDGRALGRVTGLDGNGRQDLLDVDGTLVPLVPALVPRIEETADGPVVVVATMPGLFDPED